MQKYNFSGFNTSDEEALKAQLLTEIIYNKADTLYVGGIAMPSITVPNLNYRFSTPTINRHTMQEIQEGGKADLSNFQWYDTYGELKKYQVRVIVNDEVKAVEGGTMQMDMNIEFAADALGYKKDIDILTALSAGAYSSNVVAADLPWTNEASQPQNDITASIAKILENATNLTEADLKNMVLLYPAKAFGQLSKPIQIGEIMESVEQFINQKGLKLAWTRNLSTDALLVVNTPKMGRHIVHDGSKIPGAENWREVGVGDGFLVTQYFDTKIVPYADGQTTSKFIGKITDVAA
jgi:hypothetical protein